MAAPNDSNMPPLGMWNKLAVLAKLRLQPQHSPLNRLYQSALVPPTSRGEFSSELICYPIALVAMAFFLLATSLAVPSREHFRQFGGLNDIGCMGVFSPAPKECSRSYAATPLDAMSPAEWAQALAGYASLRRAQSASIQYEIEPIHFRLYRELEKGSLFFAGPVREMELLARAQAGAAEKARAAAELVELAALGSTLLKAVEGSEGLAKPLAQARELATKTTSKPVRKMALVQATVSSSAQRARLRRLGDPSEQASRSDALQAAIGAQVRQDDPPWSGWAMFALLLASAIAFGIFLAKAIAITQTASREDRALRLAFDYIQLDKIRRPQKRTRRSGRL